MYIYIVFLVMNYFRYQMLVWIKRSPPSNDQIASMGSMGYARMINDFSRLQTDNYSPIIINELYFAGYPQLWTQSGGMKEKHEK